MFPGIVEILHEGVHRKGLAGSGRTDDHSVHVIDLPQLAGIALNVDGHRDHRTAVANMYEPAGNALIVSVPETVAQKRGQLAVEEIVIPKVRRIRGDRRVVKQGSDTRLGNHRDPHLGKSRDNRIADLGDVLPRPPGQQGHEALDRRRPVPGRFEKILA